MYFDPIWNFTARAVTFRTPQYNRIVLLKLTMMRTILTLGYHGMVVDADVFFVSDPWPVISDLAQACDYVYQRNGEPDALYRSAPHGSPGEEGNTGYHFLKAGPNTIQLLKDAERECAITPGIDDQTNFWNVLRRWQKSGRACFGSRDVANCLTYCPLPSLRHLVGRHLYNIDWPTHRHVHAGLKAEQLWRRAGGEAAGPVGMIHANYLYCVEEKVFCFKAACWVSDPLDPSVCTSSTMRGDELTASWANSWVTKHLHDSIKNLWLPECVTFSTFGSGR